jgi:hypothetical protein
VLEAEDKVRVIKKNLEAAQAMQKSYHDKRRKLLQFKVGDHVYLKVSPTKGVQRFGIKGKLAPRYIGCWGEGKDATLRSMPSPTSLHQRRQDDWQIYPSSHASPDEDL